jgi:beta-N-acetylhexosaminidase
MPKFNNGICCTLIVALNFIVVNAFAQKESYIQSLNTKNRWVDSVYNKLSRRQRVAQLLFVRAHTNKGKAYEDSDWGSGIFSGRPRQAGYPG